MKEAFHVYSVNKFEVFCAACFNNVTRQVLAEFHCSPMCHETNKLKTNKSMYKTDQRLFLVFAKWHEFEFNATSRNFAHEY